MALFTALVDPRPGEVILDVGGYPATWTAQPQRARRVDCLNVHPIEWDSPAFPGHCIETLLGDGCALDLKDDSYDIVFSNSVIEHVGDWERQGAFAAEARRVGKRLWIQTPALECPLEPHYLAPFVHWLPVAMRRRLLRWFTPWGWMTRPSREEIDDTIAHTRLLSKKQMKTLFPDCRIITERLLWAIPKSYIACRTGDNPASRRTGLINQQAVRRSSAPCRGPDE